MGRIYDQDEPHPGEIDPNDCELPVCPTCGAPVEVLQWPDRRTWFGSNGRGRCTVCKSYGPLNLQELDENGNAMEWRSARMGNGLGDDSSA